MFLLQWCLQFPFLQQSFGSTDQYMILPSAIFLGSLPFRPLALGVALDVGNRGSWQCAAVGRASHDRRHRQRPTHAPGDGHDGDKTPRLIASHSLQMPNNLKFCFRFLADDLKHHICTCGFVIQKSHSRKIVHQIQSPSAFASLAASRFFSSSSRRRFSSGSKSSAKDVCRMI